MFVERCIIPRKQSARDLPSFGDGERFVFARVVKLLAEESDPSRSRSNERERAESNDREISLDEEE